jgi:hypothetical protein
MDIAHPDTLRPILWGGRAPVAYHPITVMREAPAPLGGPAETSRFLRQFGISLLPSNLAPLAPASFREEDGLLKSDAPDFAFASATGAAGEAIGVRWLSRTPNRLVLEVGEGASEVIVKESRMPGWFVSIDGGEAMGVKELGFEQRIDLPDSARRVAWAYRPGTWRSGLFLTALGFAVVVAITGGEWSARRRRRRGLA